jgi:hypothetical protein
MTPDRRFLLLLMVGTMIVAALALVVIIHLTR